MGNGILRVHGRAAATFPMATRFLAIGNLKREGARGHACGRSLSLRDLSAGIEGVGFLGAEDVRRFDAVFVASREEAENASPERGPAAAIDVDQLKELLQAYWRLGTDEREKTVWHAGAYERLLTAAEELNERFACDAVPIFGSDTADKLARFSAALARLIPVRVGWETHISEAHVVIARQMLEEIYDRPACGLEGIARREREASALLTDKELTAIYRAISQDVPPKDLDPILDAFACRSRMKTGELAAKIGCGIRKARACVAVLRDAGLVRSHGRGGVGGTPLLRALIESRERRRAEEQRDG